MAEVLSQQAGYWGAPLEEADVSKQLQQALQGIGVTHLTSIQEQALPHILSGISDVLIRSETGSGKTLAYALPVVERLCRASKLKKINRADGTYALIMVPTHELVSQVENVFLKLTKWFPFLVVGNLMGGEQKHKEKSRLRKGVTILVATPGRLADHLRTTGSFKVQKLKCIVYDEADRLLDLGFDEQLREIHMELKAKATETGGRLQTILASATLDTKVQSLAAKTLEDPITITRKSATATPPAPVPDPPAPEEAEGQASGKGDDVLRETDLVEGEITLPDTLVQSFLVCKEHERMACLAAFLMWKIKVLPREEREGKSKRRILVFASSTDVVEHLFSIFSDLREPGASDGNQSMDPDVREATEALMAGDVDAEDMWEGAAEEANMNMTRTLMDKVNLFKLHGNIPQSERAGIYRGFNQCDVGIMFCTDVAARGVDFPDVHWIVQFDPPGPERTYVHRVGRTARIGKKGEALLMVTPQEKGYLDLLKVKGLKLAQIKLSMVAFQAAKDGRLGKVEEVSDTIRILQRQIERSVERDSSILRLAQLAANSFVACYNAHPKRLRGCFNSQTLNAGSVMSSFGIKKKVQEIGALKTGKQKKEELKKIKEHAGAVARKRASTAALPANKRQKTAHDYKMEREGKKTDQTAGERNAQAYVPSLLVKTDKRMLNKMKDERELKQATKKAVGMQGGMGEFDSALPAAVVAKKKALLKSQSQQKGKKK